jgi:predicted lipoprotein with Yx(FWY)xxD motif/cytochrome c2
MEPQPSPQSSPWPLVFLRAARDNLVSNLRAEISFWKKPSVRRIAVGMAAIGIIGIIAYVIGIAVSLSDQGGNGGYYGGYYGPPDRSTFEPEPTIEGSLPEVGFTLQIEENDKLGPILTDGEGMTLYMFDADQPDRSVCYDACSENWPPVTISSDPEVDEQVNTTLIGIIQRTTGETQLTYNGHPLYYNAADEAAGDVQGHQVEGGGGLWTAITPEGEPVPVGEETPPGASAEIPATPSSGSDLKAQGMTIAQDAGCLACHSTDGSILVGPTWQGAYGSQDPLTDGTTVTVDDEYLRESIVDPDAKVVQEFQPSIMPQNYGETLSDSDIEAIIAYIKSLQ